MICSTSEICVQESVYNPYPAGNGAKTATTSSTTLTYFYLEGLLGVDDLFGCSEVDVKGKRGLGSNNAVLLAETELFPKCLQPTEFPGHRQQGGVVQIKNVCLLPATVG